MSTAPDDRPDAIDTTVQKTYRWLRELAVELGVVGRDDAYDVLRGFLHTLRDRLTIDEAADLAAQLPMLIRGLYYEGWDPSRVPIKMKAVEFLESFAARSGYALDVTSEVAVKAANRVLWRHISGGEALDVWNSLPEDVQALLSD
jgi:uncharacterized protein (DUF2267 family)